MLFRRLVLNSFAKLKLGRLEVILPDGSRGVYGGLGAGIQARIEVTDENFFKRCVLNGPIGFSEGYMAGEWTTDDLVKVIAWFILNADDTQAMQTSGSRGTGFFNLLNAANRLFHLRRPNSKAISKKKHQRALRPQ
jgi:cyclopropane-fatty-acyl-phospholipid synthase